MPERSLPADFDCSVRRFFINVVVNTTAKKVDSRTAIAIDAMTIHPSKPSIKNFFSGTSGGSGLQDFAQS